MSRPQSARRVQKEGAGAPTKETLGALLRKEKVKLAGVTVKHKQVLKVRVKGDKMRKVAPEHYDPYADEDDEDGSFYRAR